MKILLLENSCYTNTMIMKRLKSKGYRIDSFTQIEDMLNNIDDGYTCFILGVDTHKKQSIEILKKVKESYTKAHIIMINIKEEVDVKIVHDAYMYGCSDFIKKPFILKELEIKIERLCNIRHDIVSVGSKCRFDFQMGILHADNFEKKFSKKERELFSILFSYKNNVVSFETIRTFVWDGEYVSLDSIRSLIRRVRRKIPFECIETIVDIGYVFKSTALFGGIR